MKRPAIAFLPVLLFSGLALGTDSKSPDQAPIPGVRIEIYNEPPAEDSIPLEVAFPNLDSGRVALTEETEGFDELYIRLIDAVTEQVLLERQIPDSLIDSELGVLDLDFSDLEAAKARLLESSSDSHFSEIKTKAKRLRVKNWQMVWSAEPKCLAIRPQLKEGFRIASGPSFFQSSKNQPKAFRKYSFYMGQCIAYRESHCDPREKNSQSSATGLFQFTKATKVDCHANFKEMLTKSWSKTSIASLGLGNDGVKVRKLLLGCMGEFRRSAACSSICYFDEVKSHPSRWVTHQACKRVLSGSLAL